MGVRKVYDAVVVGGGVMGLAVAEASTRVGASVLLLEARDFEHERGSSHGAARIARSTYHDPLYARWMREALHEDWPRLERDAGEKLLLSSPACVFGPADGEIATYERVCRETDADVERLGAAEAARAFPALRLDEPGIVVLRDRTAAVVAARATRAALLRLAVQRGAVARARTRCTGWTARDEGIVVHTSAGDAHTMRLVLCPGAWTASLAPELAPRLTVIRQAVAFFELAEPSGPSTFPIWIRLGGGANELCYGLPRFLEEGVKIARHVVALGERDADDPDAPPSPLSSAETEDLRALLEQTCRAPVRRFVRGERCLYTMAPREDFVLGPLAGDDRVLVATGFSGHGFKFAPLIGRLVATGAGALPARLHPPRGAH